MRGFLARLLITSFGLWIADLLLTGVRFAGAGALFLAAFLLVVTIVVLLVRSSFQHDSSTPPPATTTAHLTTATGPSATRRAIVGNSAFRPSAAPSPEVSPH